MDSSELGSPAGLVLAAGSGRRYGGPKALVRTADGTTWVERTVLALADAGCAPILVTAAPGREAIEALVAGRASVVAVADADEGMSASLRVGLGAVGERALSIVVMLVDLPDVDAAVVRRVLDAVDATDPGVLARASYDGRPGHPVVIGRDHVAGLIEGLSGDAGARGYLERHDVQLVECGDLATGLDVDQDPTAH